MCACVCACVCVCVCVRVCACPCRAVAIGNFSFSRLSLLLFLPFPSFLFFSRSFVLSHRLRASLAVACYFTASLFFLVSLYFLDALPCFSGVLSLSFSLISCCCSRLIRDSFCWQSVCVCVCVLGISRSLFLFSLLLRHPFSFTFCIFFFFSLYPFSVPLSLSSAVASRFPLVFSRRHVSLSPFLLLPSIKCIGECDAPSFLLHPKFACLSLDMTFFSLMCDCTCRRPRLRSLMTIA